MYLKKELYSCPLSWVKTQLEFTTITPSFIFSPYLSELYLRIQKTSSPKSFDLASVKNWAGGLCFLLSSYINIGNSTYNEHLTI